MNTAKQVVNPLRELSSYGQSVWLDFIRRNLLNSGELKRLVDEDGLKGMTSNPAIFEKAIAGSNDYADTLAALRKDSKLTAMDIYEHIAVEDIQKAADILKPVYEKTQKRDGYVSMEVSPFLANETQKTIDEAKRLWKWINRPNVMIKVPATKEGIPAIKELIASGINVNVTLLFSQEAYEAVHWAYIDGLEQFHKSGGDLSTVASVASFFVSRIDTLIDSIIEEKLKTAQGDEKTLLNKVIGKVAIANAKQAYQKYLHIIADARWKELAKHGAQTQRLLWASTSTKNPAFPDCIYVDELIGKDTVNTIPPSTFDAFRDHGVLKNTLEANIAQANEVMENLEKSKISMKEVTDKLVVQGVDLFADAFKKLLDAVEKARTSEPKSLIDNIKYVLPADLKTAVEKTTEEWQSKDNMKKLWSRDASLWTGDDESKWLDWLNIINDQLAHIANLKKLSTEIKDAKFKYALLLGMGGSSLCPDVLRMTFPKVAGYPELHVLDSTDPQQVRAAEKAIDVKQTIFIVSSKSGTTLEPNIMKQYFWQKTVEAVGADKAGQHWIAVTDPGSKLLALAESEKFRHIFLGLPGIGGRYSALSNFGMVPAAVMGLDVEKFLDSAREMAHACAGTVPVKENPGAMLGIIMGAAAKAGRDKLTIITSAKINDLGAWLEQLIAESTGKNGKGIIPVDREMLAQPDVYGKDRVFAYLHLANGADEKQDKAVDALEKAGHPVIRITVDDIYNLGQEFFRWEIATAVAGAVIGINAFNQPDVEASKVATRELTEAYEKSGKLPEEKPFFEADGVKLFADEKNAKEIESAAGSTKTLVSMLKAHLARVKENDYVALLGYIEMTAAHEEELQAARLAIRDSKKVATCLGFGPRFLHSTGQAYKGGPNSGVFLQVTADDTEELPVPQQKYTFGIVKAAQARGDLKVLDDRGRRALRVHLGKDVAKGLKALSAAVKEAVK
ncbi:MAG: bifunctional transaldolase/phosoglucose isomerase [Candidatus Melainabacteria bacterium]|jgi:transaldolase/glucose-6-phosphate isomerase|nr:bifunctional transaldolase/phosoglucose isomerase [Candidatus Melainabacteria bacterium]